MGWSGKASVAFGTAFIGFGLLYWATAGDRTPLTVFAPPDAVLTLEGKELRRCDLSNKRCKQGQPDGTRKLRYVLYSGTTVELTASLGEAKLRRRLHLPEKGPFPPVRIRADDGASLTMETAIPSD